MFVKLGVLFLLISLSTCNQLPSIYTVDGLAPYDNGGPLIVNRGIYNFQNDENIISAANSIFENVSTFSANHENLFQNMDENKMQIFLGFAANAPNGRGQKFLDGWNHDRLKQWAEALTKEDIEAISTSGSDGSQGMLALIFQYLKSDAISGISATAFNRLYYNGTIDGDYRRYFHQKYLERFSREWIEENAASILGEFGDDAYQDYRQLMGLIPISFMRALLANVDNCNLIGINLLKLLADKFPSLLIGKCFERVDPAALANFKNPIAKLLPLDVYESVASPLNYTNFTHMTEEQARRFGGKRSKDDICSNLLPQYMPDSAFGSLSQECLRNWFTLRISNDYVNIGKRWKLVTESFFNDLSDELIKNIAEKTQSSDYLHFKDGHINKFLSIKSICSILPSEAFGTLRNVTITNECFTEMKPDTQVAVLQRVTTLPDDLFTLLKADHVIRWIIQRGLHAFTGLSILNADLRIANIDKIIDGIGRKDDNVEPSTDNPCATINNLEKLAQNKLLQKYMNGACAQSIQINFQYEDFNHLLPRVKALMSMEVLEKLIKDWKVIDEDFFGLLVKNEKFCQEVSVDILKDIKQTALNQVNSKCFFNIKDKENIPKEIIRKFSQNCTRLIQSDDKLSLDNLTDEQFGQLGADVTDTSASGALLITDSQISSSSPTRISLIKVWNLIPAASFTGLKKEHITMIKPETMDNWKLSQIQKIKPEVLLELKADQVTHIGSASRESVLSVFTKDIKGKMEKDALEALEKRLAGEVKKTSFSFKQLEISQAIIGLCLFLATALHVMV